MKILIVSRKIRLVVLGFMSAGLYALLFTHADTLIRAEELVREGHALYALIPIGIAFSVSLVHGTFTSHFWDALGLKPKTSTIKR